MKLINRLRSKQVDDLLFVCQSLLNHYSIRHSSLFLNKLLQDHVDYPSLLSIKDVLLEYGIDSAALRKGNYNYYDFETPFICSIQKEGWHKGRFTLVSEVNQTYITFLDPETNLFTQTLLSDFEQIDKGILLLTDASKKKDEPNLSGNLIQQRNQKIVRVAPVYLLVISLILSLGHSIFSFQEGISWVNIIFSVTSFIGLLVAASLIWHEIDAYNPISRQVCGANGKKLNCDAVLNSDQASFLGISWSIWGAAYMATLFFIQFFFSGQIGFIYISSYFSLVVAPYIIYSLYYQAKVIKQWCPLCLIIQALLLINFLTAVILISTGFRTELLSPYPVLLTGLIAIFILTSLYILIPIFKSAQQSKTNEKNWKKLKYNPEVFRSLLNKSERIISPTDGLGIIIGNPNAKNEIIKVCNPYCGPCAKAHPELENIVNNNRDVKIRIIFTASGEDTDIRTAPVRHLLAIQEKSDGQTLHDALDDWYLAKEKNYPKFAEKYPMNGELNQQKQKMIEMQNWCNIMKIRATPTIFINGSELPDEYLITEIKNFF